jgi:hypothetical protein
VVFSLVVVSGCATSQKTVDMQDARRVVGTENEVRVDAEVYGDRLNTSTTLPIKYDITNQRSQPILVADIVPDASYDDETQMVTISIGSEVPGNVIVPRLIQIGPGEKKSFNTAAHIAIRAVSVNSPWVRHPNAVRIRVNFLDDTAPFQQLIAIKETGIISKQLANALFSKWIEDNETVTTNALPMAWAGARTDAFNAANPGQPPPVRRGGRAGG